jgi:hypothetical protein
MTRTPRETTSVTKYQPLSDHLARLKGAEWRPTFHELERTLGFALPHGARARARWWRNSDRGHAAAWTAADWEVDDVDLEEQIVAFRRRGNGAAAPERDEGPAIPVKTLAVMGGLLLAVGAGVTAYLVRNAGQARRRRRRPPWRRRR